ncbi:GIN domain-containing protein [Thalassobellus citreus]|uniref:GIN domain-containing protein n=1 Tax=Thalassobellus citreus TaxID=3367752 RepID=UPI00379C8B62
MKNKQFLALIFSISFVFFNYAQKIEKVKGNRNLTIEQSYINSFHTIIVDEDFEIDLIYNNEPSVEIEADENLHEFIVFEVRDSILSFNKTRRITSKKKLHIKVFYDDYLSTIETREDAEIYSISTINLANVNLITSGSSKAELTIKTLNFNFEGLDKSKTRLNLTADSTKVVLNSNSKLEALINSPIVKTDLYQRAQATIEGDCDDLLLRTDNTSKFTGKNFTTKTCNLICEMDSDAILEITDAITLEASGSSAVYLYNNPKIIVNRLTENSKIQKKEK